MSENKRNNRKRYIYISALCCFILLVVIGVVFSDSFALFKKEIIVKDFQIKVGDLTYTLESDKLLSDSSITLDASKSVNLTVKITSTSEIPSKYALYYVLYGDDTSSQEVGYYENTKDLPEGIINPGETKVISLKIVNNCDSGVAVKFGVTGGFDYNELEITEGERITTVFPAPPTVSETAFLTENLGENCITYDDGVDTFLAGQCSQNYVWYSGKLWRVVLKNNETGAVKMVTDNGITAISYNAEGNFAFENSYLDQWLNQEFLPTLHDYQDYLVVNSVWDTSVESSKTPSRPTGETEVTRTVGLLNIYEYYTTYNRSNKLATAKTVYLNNQTMSWLINSGNASLDSTSQYWIVNAYGFSPFGSHGSATVRPSVYLQTEVQISDGIGTIDSPYRLVDDEQETVNGTTLLSTRYSGEYVRFNNHIYRIVSVENGKVKITALDKPSELSNNGFHSANGTIVFGHATIKTDLDNYYQNNIVLPYRSMIAENQTWYLGKVEENMSYKASICSTVDDAVDTASCARVSTIATANVGLPRVGEMFASQNTRFNKEDFWTLTSFGNMYVHFVDSDGHLNGAVSSNSVGARPSMYLKSNVVISKDNTGDGTYESPYDIELAS